MIDEDSERNLINEVPDDHLAPISSSLQCLEFLNRINDNLDTLQTQVRYLHSELDKIRFILDTGVKVRPESTDEDYTITFPKGSFPSFNELFKDKIT